MREDPSNSNLTKSLSTSANHLKRTKTEAVWRFFEGVFSQREVRIKDGDQSGSYRHLKWMDFEGKKLRCSQFINDTESSFLRDTGLIRDRWVQWSGSLFNTRSITLDPNIIEDLKIWPPCAPLEDLPLIFDLEKNIKSMSTGRLLDPMISPLN